MSKKAFAIAGAAAAGAAAAGCTASALINAAVMNRTLEDGLEVLKRQYTVTEVSAAPYEKVALYGLMKFDVSRYEVKDLGNLCLMTMNMGLMQMSTFVLTPYRKDLPLLSLDFIYTFSGRKAIVECYDLTARPDAPEYRKALEGLQAAADAFSDLEEEERDPDQQAWYDNILSVRAHRAGKASQDDRFRQMMKNMVAAYIAAAQSLPALSEEQEAEKREITEKYCRDMVADGGVSTRMFKKALGEETTLDFFARVFYGTVK